MVVKVLKTLIANSFLCCVVWMFWSGCKPGKKDTDLQSVLASATSKSIFIGAHYKDQEPLIQLLNPGNYTDLQDSFLLNEPTDIQIYGVGEILYDLSDAEKLLYLQSDAVDLFFKDLDTNAQQRGAVKYVFSLAESSLYKEEKIEYSGLKERKGYYFLEVKIPWSVLGIDKPSEGFATPFNIEIGDNDDGFMQKARMALVKNTSSMIYKEERFGVLSLAGKGEPSIEGKFYSIPGSPQIDTVVEAIWSGVPSYPIQHVVYGFVKDEFDLSATVQSCWDQQNVYFLFKVRDSRQKFISKKKVKERGIFTDFGWIENSKGEKVWEMHAKHSDHAGGAFRNQKVDTVLRLPAGRYKVVYVSDESHSYNNWVEDPPDIPFYGIVLYKHIPGH
jgi:hypothetical protein